MDGNTDMTKSETITIKLNSDTLEEVRRLALKDYRSISKQIAFIIDGFISNQKKEGK
jgi:hypothetical protein